VPLHNTVFIFFFKFEVCQEIEVFKPNHGILYILFLKFMSVDTMKLECLHFLSCNVMTLLTSKII